MGLFIARDRMIRKDLEDCIALRHEIQAIKESMENPKSTYVSIFYKDYRTGKGIPKSMTGLDNGEEQLRILTEALIDRRKKLIRKLASAEKFINGLDDTEIRAIFRMYYINGTSQAEIGRIMNYSQAAISTKINAFWFARNEKKNRTKSKHKSDNIDKKSVL